MKKIKIIIPIVLILIIALTIFFKDEKIEKVSVQGQEKLAYTTVKKEKEDNIYVEGKLDSKNASYEINDKRKVIIYDYIDDVDCVIIDGKIDGYPIDEIDEETFKNCENLEMIKVTKEIRQEFQIKDF